MSSLKSNLVKRIERLPKPTNVATALQPLFEAVSNSIHSTQDKFGPAVSDNGRIIVTVETDRKKTAPAATVEDNGVGLDDKNYDAFITTDTDNKIAIGGKGVGRLLWLDCFEDITVNSTFADSQGKMLRRSFKFVLSHLNQIQDHSIVESRDFATSFMVQFSGLRNNGYLAKFPGRKDYIFQHFTSHFLPTFIGGRCPLIQVHCGGESRNYPADIDSIVYRRSPEKEIETQEYGLLKITLMECDKVASSDLKGSHFVHFIAHDRTVKSQAIDSKLGLKFFGANSDRVFHAILTGKFLDANVNQERTAFMFEDSILDRIISDVCWTFIEKFLEEPLSRLGREQKITIEEITDSYPSVAFGSIEELQEKIPSGELNGDAIYGHLSRERYRRDQRQAQKIRSVLKRLKDGTADSNAFSAAIDEARRAIEDAEQKSLAEYVVRRKVVLDFIEILLQKVKDDDRDSSYQREDILHSFICPLRVNTIADGTKRVEPAASHDLWIIDERLTFAQYFSSDTEFAALSSSTDEKDRPDILIFDHVHGLRQTDDPSKVLLVELKRPGRSTYADSDNPHMQVQRYIRKLLAGEKTDVKGRPIQLNQDTVFYCFIIADIIGKLDEWTFSWPRTADGRGRFLQPQSGFKGVIELVGWDTLLSDARARNRAFFDKAGISGRSFFSDE